MASIKLSLNEGSLVRRTVLHVGAFVLGTAAFLALASFLLVTIVQGLVSPEKTAASSSDDSGDESVTGASTAGSKPARPPRKKRGAAAVEAPKPAADEDQ